MSTEKRTLTVGILAHVDAGKTTLSESILYLSGRIRRAGRVDHGDTYLDTDPMERERGITIFSKMARFSRNGTDFVLLDTPGHVDFSAEAERTLQVLDYAVLVISGSDGVQNHTLTLWQLLRTYRVPVFVFVNKTDLWNSDPETMEAQMRARLDPACFAVIPGQRPAARDERLAMTAEGLLDTYLSRGSLSDADIAAEIAGRRLFPCFFGSALKMTGVEEFMDALTAWTLQPDYPENFGARVYKIARDDGQRLTWLKITGGALSVRDELTYVGEDGRTYKEKAAQLRLYSGDRFTQIDLCRAGEIVTVPGLCATYAGQGLGAEPDSLRPVLEPVLTYGLTLPPDCDVNQFFPRLKQLEEEDPALHLVWQEQVQQIHARLMGEVQIDVLKRTVKERFGIDIGVDEGQILYKETLSHAAEGVGHYEPLRHYAEVHLLLEPLPAGCGLVFDTVCPEEQLERNWQRLVLTHLGEKSHLGVLTGSPITDMKITLLTGRSHVKHTEGGDFREATYRAVRQGLMQVPSVLLEPYYRYTLEVPTECVGRAMSDLGLRCSDFEQEQTGPDSALLRGRGPVSELRDYPREVTAYTHGRGRMAFVFDGYAPCHNADDVIAARGYSPTADLANSPDSVFCAHGAGFVVPWDHVREHMHVNSGFSAQGLRNKGRGAAAAAAGAGMPLRSPRALARSYHLDDKALEAIAERSAGPIRRRQYSEAHTVTASAPAKAGKPKPPKKPLLILDGYNLIFQWEFLSVLAEDCLEDARTALMDLLASYVAYTGSEVILVFDAYNSKEGGERESTRDGYRVVFTAPNVTADAYIEKLAHDLGGGFSIRVVTSDRLIQLSAVASGTLRMSSREFLEEIRRVDAQITDFIRKLTE